MKLYITQHPFRLAPLDYSYYGIFAMDEKGETVYSRGSDFGPWEKIDDEGVLEYFRNCEAICLDEFLTKDYVAKKFKPTESKIYELPPHLGRGETIVADFPDRAVLKYEFYKDGICPITVMRPLFVREYHMSGYRLVDVGTDVCKEPIEQQSIVEGLKEELERQLKKESSSADVMD